MRWALRMCSRRRGLVPDVKAVVCITILDKVYRDQDWVRGYREQDPLGGKDPYSASKACAELVAASYRATLAERGNGVLIGESPAAEISLAVEIGLPIGSFRISFVR